MNKIFKPIKELTLFYNEETEESPYPYGGIESELIASRVVLKVYQDNTCTMDFECGRVYYGVDEDCNGEKLVDWEICKPFDLDSKDLDINELKELLEYKELLN